MTIRQATPQDLDQLANLFAQYRAFYEQAFDLEAGRRFLEERLNNGESVVFIAFENDVQVGFTQLYPCFSSVGLKKIWILNDLFVLEAHRKKGVAQSLISEVVAHSKATGRTKIILSTAYTNASAQKLYERLGFIREDFYNYELIV